MFIKDINRDYIFMKVAVTIVIAILVLSCKEDLPVTESIDATVLPTQIIENMSVQQTDAGIVVLRVVATKMERFTQAKEPYDNFPNGINVKAFTKEGLLETEIRSNYAKHISGTKEEIWQAYGQVVINNYIKGQKMFTDTLYWDKNNKKIFTQCYVKMTTPDVVMQGYGMESDDMARNAILLRPFDSDFVIARDSLEVPYIDSVNFIGPLLRKKK